MRCNASHFTTSVISAATHHNADTPVAMSHKKMRRFIFMLKSLRHRKITEHLVKNNDTIRSASCASRAW